MVIPEDWIKAHQYLYYVKGVNVWSDQQYDEYCKKHDIFGGGGSDSQKSYSSDIIRLANRIWEVHNS